MKRRRIALSVSDIETGDPVKVDNDTEAMRPAGRTLLSKDLYSSLFLKIMVNVLIDSLSGSKELIASLFLWTMNYF